MFVEDELVANKVKYTFEKIHLYSVFLSKIERYDTI